MLPQQQGHPQRSRQQTVVRKDTAGRSRCHRLARRQNTGFATDQGTTGQGDPRHRRAERALCSDRGGKLCSDQLLAFNENNGEENVTLQADGNLLANSLQMGLLQP
ncbi:uncharacterized protein LOC116841286 isoform X1 [Odontomachus brunneus]|uniref:uncharacterized protein LOC116841286 isoform X1 n=1 Tax=Odontomachus brunneus TaxID=486640 RepID=UPI0013F24F4C|nr:uncharacterized protein LOC116841286 isoform X1 [Odontomachus brunneus]